MYADTDRDHTNTTPNPKLLGTGLDHGELVNVYTANTTY